MPRCESGWTMPRSHVTGSTQRGAHTLSARRVTPRSIALPAADSGAVLLNGPGVASRSTFADGLSRPSRTMSVSMKLKYATPTRVPVWAISARRLSQNASTPALVAA